ncbi:MAG: FAD-dependent oxidoreductase, partial [Chloroflexota bacterium]|nr:FAD-dependent oxidoreductase [Chloroflexota bacterium]
MAKYLIIGNSAGAVGALEAIKKVDSKGSCAVVSEEPYVAYSRPAIAEYLMGERAFDHRMHYRDQDYYVRNGIEAHLGVRATRLLLEQRQVELSDGRKLEYEKLLLATGGQPIVPRMEGLELQGIYPFITIEHARKLDEALKKGAKRVVVIGGGLIGCSLTHALA